MNAIVEPSVSFNPKDTIAAFLEARGNSDAFLAGCGLSREMKDDAAEWELLYYQFFSSEKPKKGSYKANIVGFLEGAYAKFPKEFFNNPEKAPSLVFTPSPGLTVLKVFVLAKCNLFLQHLSDFLASERHVAFQDLDHIHNGSSALGLALLKNDVTATRLLQSFGADVRLSDVNGQTLRGNPAAYQAVLEHNGVDDKHFDSFLLPRQTRSRDRIVDAEERATPAYTAAAA